MSRPTGSEKQKALVTAVNDAGKMTTTIQHPYPDLTAGDLAFLDQARPHDVQIRPMLSNERPPSSTGNYPAGTMWLVWNSASGVQVRAIVTMPAPYRKNIGSNVARAIRQTMSFSKAHGQLFALAHAGLDPLAPHMASGDR